MQQPQPTLTHAEMGHNPHQQYKWLHLEDGYAGGGALRFVGRLPNTGKALTYRSVSISSLYIAPFACMIVVTEVLSYFVT